MGTFWEASGKPNFSPIVYNMGSPLFVWGWFLFWLGSCGIPIYKELLDSASSSTGVDLGEANATFPGNDIYAQESPSIPLFLNVRTLLAFVAGCGMVPVVGFLDYSHDLDGPWLGENTEGKVFGKWWLGTDGTYFGVFLESPCCNRGPLSSCGLCLDSRPFSATTTPLTLAGKRFSSLSIASSKESTLGF